MIRRVLLECVEKQVWKEQTVVNVKTLVNRVRVKLIEKYKCLFRQVLTWRRKTSKYVFDAGRRVNTSNKLRTYSKIRINYEREQYTEANIPLAYKKCITSLVINLK